MIIHQVNKANSARKIKNKSIFQCNNLKLGE